MGNADRRRRLERLLDIRKTEVEKRSGELAAAHERQRAALSAYTAAHDRTIHALAERDERAKRNISIEEWMGVEQWLARVRALENVALQSAAVAEREVQAARARLAAAQREQEKMDRLLLRLSERERQEQNRADQKTTDEAATTRFLKRREERA